MEEKYLIDDEEIFLTNAFNTCTKLVKRTDITKEDKNKCKEFLNCFYYLDEMKSIV